MTKFTTPTPEQKKKIAQLAAHDVVAWFREHPRQSWQTRDDLLRTIRNSIVEATREAAPDAYNLHGRTRNALLRATLRSMAEYDEPNTNAAYRWTPQFSRLGR